VSVVGLIAVLPPTLASQIAAGEVVDRPASALKELLENALDAEATRLDVTIAGGGVTLLSVRDNGVGMGPADVALCVERHATSKLHAFEDLSQLLSFGFRGEALPSIASVSKLTVRSRRRDDTAGTEVVVTGGELSPPRAIGMAPGTEVIVEDLFYNVPARRKFLRSSGTESGYLAEVAEQVALANPQVSLVLTRDGRKAREWLRVRSREERVREVLADETLAKCYGERGPLTVEAYLGRPERAKSAANGLRLFCNSRPVRDRALMHSVVQAYGSVLERGRYPRGVVYLNLPQQLVDVNVHPQKTEVRFADARAVADALFDIVTAELQTAFSLPTGGANRWQPSSPSSEAKQGELPSYGGERQVASPVTVADRLVEPLSPLKSERLPNGHAQHPSPHPRYSSGVSGAHPAVDGVVESLQTEHAAPHKSSWEPTSGVNVSPRRVTETGSDVAWSKLRFIAQVRNLYLICESDAGLFVLDQHAAAERVAFDKLKRQMNEQHLAGQALLFPAVVQLSGAQMEALEVHSARVTELGFEVRRRSENSVSVHQVPKLLHKAEPERLFLDLVNELVRDGRNFSQGLDLMLATMACHGAVRAGDPLAREECEALLRALDEVQFAGHCPHGRPIVTFTPWSELERKVGRR
jgi:DNA mismatch repair protein MutL